MPRPTTYYLAWDDGHLYLAARTWIAPGTKPRCYGREPGAAGVFDAGLELHFARCRYLYRFTSAGASTKWTGYSQARGLGLYASVSWERPIFGPVSFLLEASGRTARLSGFDGSGVLKNPDGRTSTEDGTLYYYESATGGKDSVPLLFIRERKPSGPGVSGAREAQVDFSGISFRAGLKVRF